MNQNASYKILVVEDDKALRRALSDKLSQLGFEVYSARHGKEGLETALDNHPNIIILDIVMPIMDGMEMLKRLREDSWGKDVAVIMLTNLNPEGETIEKIAPNEPSYYLVKSNCSLEDVIDKVQEVRKKIS